jgi:hypothetical protein
MAEKLDVAARLVEGRQAVDNVQNYVWASHLVGYQHADLTLHPAQVRDWYASEDGLDLRALDADCAALEAVVAATEGALRLQDDQVATLTDAWRGGGADASREFLWRHHEASAAAAAAVRTAADALSSLRDNLWQMVDGKVAAAMAIDDRRQAERAEWLAAAHTVTTGAGDRAVASELIDQQVKAFVDNDIRADWLTAMRTTIAAVAASYDAATAGLTAVPAAVFDVPGDLGPPWTPSPGSVPATDEPERLSVPTVPAAAAPVPPVAPPVAPAAPAMPTATAPPPPAPALAPLPMPTPMPSGPALEPSPAAAPPPAPAMPAAPLGDLGSGLSGVGQGLSGIGQQLADALGGLLNAPDNALQDADDAPEVDEPGEPDEPGLNDRDVSNDDPSDEPSDDPTDDELDPDDAAESEDDAAPDEEAAVPGEVKETTGEPVDGCDAKSEEPQVEPAPTPAPLPPPPAPMPVAEPPPPGSPQAGSETPCEIAADELPQAGQ